MNNQNDYSILDSELRQSLLRGYSRLRQYQAQGRKLDEAERVLELLGDPQLLTIEHPRFGWKLTIPLIYVASWDLQKGDRLRNVVVHKVPEYILTTYKRRHQEDESHQRRIHTKLVRALTRYVEDHEVKGGFLLDIHSAPRPEEPDHDEMVTENWYGFHDPTRNPHWLFEDTEPQHLPSQIWQVNSLIRLTFPLYPDRREYPYKMMTIVLGLGFLSPAQEPLLNDMRRRMMKWVRRLAGILMDDIVHLQNIVQKREGVDRINLIPPEWLKNTERDALHLAVDDLHRRVIELASRVSAKEWNEPAPGRNNFLIAFKELNKDYVACLRYRLTIPNLQTIGAGFSEVSTWRAYLEERLEASKGDLRDLFLRIQKDGEPGDGEPKFLKYYRDCQQAIIKIFDGVEDIDEARRKVAEIAEATPYRMLLTPGYYVMYLSHPEIIQSWLHDPRVTNFEEYPTELFVWENTALPPKIYYSQIADGTISIGICGVNAELLEKCPSYYELQEIIDDSGPRFRYIICEEQFHQLKEELKEDLRMLKGRPRLWASVLKRFRRLAYYHFQNPWDYHTKLVYDSEIQHFEGRSWIKHRNKKWHEIAGLTHDDIAVLKSSGHIPSDEKWQDEPQKQHDGDAGRQAFYETDFIKRYLENYLRPEWADTKPDLKRARLHRLKMRNTGGEKGDTSLLVLVPDPQNNDFAKELITRFLTQCELAYADHQDAIKFNETYKENRLAETEDGAHDVFLCYHSEDRDEVRAIAEQLKKNGINPWWDLEITPGVPWIDTLEKELETIKSAAVFIGKGGIGPFQRMEVWRVIDSFMKEGRPLIPALLLGATMPDRSFLKNYHRVDFNRSDPDPMKELIRGIRGGTRFPDGLIAGSRVKRKSSKDGRAAGSVVKVQETRSATGPDAAQISGRRKSSRKRSKREAE